MTSDNDTRRTYPHAHRAQSTFFVNDGADDVAKHRAEHGRRVEARERANQPWDRAKETGLRIFDEDTGERIGIRAIVANLQAHPAHYEHLKNRITNIAGGATFQHITGTWVDPAERRTYGVCAPHFEERGVLIEVSGSPETFRLSDIRRIICQTAYEIGEKWVHFEVYRFQAMHTQVNE